MIPSDQVPAGVDWVPRRLADLERQVRELAAGLASHGLTRPWVPVTWAGAISTQWPSTTSASFVPVLEAALPRQQPRITVRIRHTTDLAGTTGDLRVMCGATQLGSVVPVTITATTTDVGPVALPAGTDVIALTVDARRTAGSGSVRAMVIASWTQQ
ncbi:hypothetical protein ACGFIW_01685 [Micromonospora sp. NPDC048935]|uniref:hypothetical protein n=1 Tax=Micromonospora sp. NPDC048935 TaxID=3364262 RepID=UPI00371DD8A0